jgi:hypothetical protein
VKLEFLQVFERFIVNIVVPEKTFNMSVNGKDSGEDQQSAQYTSGKQTINVVTCFGQAGPSV